MRENVNGCSENDLKVYILKRIGKFNTKLFKGFTYNGLG